MSYPQKINRSIDYLNSLIAVGENLLLIGHEYAAKNKFIEQPKTITWATQTLKFLTDLYGRDSIFAQGFAGCLNTGDRYEWACIRDGLHVLYGVQADMQREPPVEVSSGQILDNIFNRFHMAAIQLRTRRKDHSPYVIEDEYDVQDLLHALLWIHFDDIHREYWTPKYAGSSLQMDMYLKSEKTGIEVKKTRSYLTEKKLGEQILIDIPHYKQIPGCRKLIFFIYDPDTLITNRLALERDLMELSSPEFTICVMIRPKIQ
jgi:hypothetical protein